MRTARWIGQVGVGALVTGVALVASTTPAEAAPPQNDDFAGAAPFPAQGALYVGSNVDATSQAGEPDHAGSTYGALHSVWYSWTPSADGPATVSTCDSDFNTRLGIYTGSSLSGLTEVDANEDSTGPGCAGSIFAEAVFDATAGTTYYIAVDTSGGYPNNDPGNEPQGDVRIEVTPGGSTEPPDAIREAPVEVSVPRFTPRCRTSGLTAEKCPESKLQFRQMARIFAWAEEARAEGGDVTIRMVPKPRTGQDGSVHDYLRDSAKGGEVLAQNVKPGKVLTTTEHALFLKVDYYSRAEDDKIAAAILKALEKAGEDKKNVKSPCEFIDTDATPDQIEARMASLLDSSYLTQRRAGEILKGFGCGYEVSEYIEAPGAPVDFVKDVTGIDRKRHLIELSVALPVRQDLLFVVREDPSMVDPGVLALGTDGRLTVSKTQFTELTVQVVERLTGRLVAGAEVSFIGPDGRPETKRTDEHGETWFAAGLTRPDRYAIVGRVALKGASMTGFRSIDVVDRGGATWVTMAGREMVRNAHGNYVSTQADVDRARALPVVPANLGTGLSGAPVAAPDVVQAEAAYPNGDGTWTAGEHNSVSILDDTNFAVGAAPGLVAIGGGLESAGRAARAWPNPFQAIADAVNHVVTGLQRAFEQGADGPGTAYERTSAEQRADIAASADALAANGAAVPPSGLISDKGLGLISDKGLGLVDLAGATLVNADGLELRDAQGNLIGQAGGNIISNDGAGLIGQAGGNVISTGGLNFTPVAGGQVISTGGLN